MNFQAIGGCLPNFLAVLRQNFLGNVDKLSQKFESICNIPLIKIFGIMVRTSENSEQHLTNVCKTSCFHS